MDIPEQQGGKKKGQKKHQKLEGKEKPDKEKILLKPKWDPAKFECFECDDLGHYVNACPTKEANVSQQEDTKK